MNSGPLSLFTSTGAPRWAHNRCNPRDASPRRSHVRASAGAWRPRPPYPQLLMPLLLRLFCTTVLAAHVTDVPQHLRIVQNANNLFFRKSLTFHRASYRYMRTLTYRLDALSGSKSTPLGG